MTEKKRWPCELTPKGLKQCWALDEVLEIGGQGTKYQGLKISTMLDMTTHKFARHLVVLKSGKHGKKGLVLNLCPFCGGKLLKNEPDDELSAGSDAESPQERGEQSNG